LVVDAPPLEVVPAPLGVRRWALAGVVVLAMALRLVPILVTPSLNWADEIFQTTEQAHRLVYGTGLVPWEFQLGIRSWILPGFIAALMEAARVLGDGPDYYIPTIALAFSALAAAPVICTFFWCERRFGLAGAVIGATVVATAPEVVYFGDRVLSEVISAHVLIIAAYLLDSDDRPSSRARLALGGALLGLAFALRPHLAPAVAVIALWPATAPLRQRLRAIITGGAATLLLTAILDTATLGSPLASIWRYTYYNLFYGVSTTYGVEPWWFYGLAELVVWDLAIVPLLVAIWVGARVMPMLLAAAVAYLAVHSGLAHKEYRFLYPAILLLAILAGLGLAQLAASATGWMRMKGWAPTAARATSLAATSLIWCVLAVQVWNGVALGNLRQRGNGPLLAASLVSHAPDLCGLGLFGRNGEDWGIYGGYTYLHRPLPIYWPKDGDEFAERGAAFNFLIATEPPPRPLGFTKVQCFADVCVWHRLGNCTPVPMTRLPMTPRLVGIFGE
jgi:GPI mannosyltransferase 3